MEFTLTLRKEDFVAYQVLWMKVAPRNKKVFRNFALYLVGCFLLGIAIAILWSPATYKGAIPWEKVGWLALIYVVFMSLLFLITIMLQRGAAFRMMSKEDRIKAMMPTFYKVDEAGLAVERDTVKAWYGWPEFEGWAENETHIILLATSRLGFVFPKDQIPASQITELRDLLEKHTKNLKNS